MMSTHMMLSLSPQELSQAQYHNNGNNNNQMTKNNSPNSATKARSRRRTKAVLEKAGNTSSNGNARITSFKGANTKNPYYAGTPLATKKQNQQQVLPQQQQQALASAGLIDVYGSPALVIQQGPLPPMIVPQQQQQQFVPAAVVEQAAAAAAPVQDTTHKHETAFEAQQRLRGGMPAASLPPQPQQQQQPQAPVKRSPYDFDTSVVNNSTSQMMNTSSNSSEGFPANGGSPQQSAMMMMVNTSTTSTPIPNNNSVPQPPVMPQQQQSSSVSRGAALGLNTVSPLVSAFALQQEQQKSGDEEAFVAYNGSAAAAQPQQPRQTQQNNNSIVSWNNNESVSNSSFPTQQQQQQAAALHLRKNSVSQFSNFDLSFMSEGDSPAPAVSLEAPVPASSAYHQQQEQQKPQHVYPPNTSFVVVAFKHELCTYQCGFFVVENDWVVVQADRGEHVGRVHRVSSSPPQFHVPSRILRHANFAEISVIENNRPNEQYAAQRLQQIAEGLQLQMRIVDAEFYSDGSKMTIFFSSKGAVDFRQFQRQAFSEFRKRVWLISMNEVQSRNGPGGKICRNRK